MSNKIVPIRPSKTTFYKEVTIDENEPINVFINDMRDFIKDEYMSEAQDEQLRLTDSKEMEDPGLSDAIELLTFDFYSNEEKLIECAKWMEAKL